MVTETLNSASKNQLAMLPNVLPTNATAGGIPRDFHHRLRNIGTLGQYLQVKPGSTESVQSGI
jgi:hypothetical protein